MSNAESAMTDQAAVGSYAARVQAEVRRFITEAFFAECLDADASFLDRGIIDSTGVLELVGFIERTYGLRVADQELVPENLDSLSNVAAFVTRKNKPQREL